MILDVNIHEMRLKLFKSVQTIGLPIEKQVGRLVDQPEIGLPDFAQHVEHRCDLFK